MAAKAKYLTHHRLKTPTRFLMEMRSPWAHSSALETSIEVFWFKKIFKYSHLIFDFFSGPPKQVKTLNVPMEL